MCLSRSGVPYVGPLNASGCKNLPYSRLAIPNVLSFDFLLLTL